MIIEKLIIKKTNPTLEIVREIKFKKGLNLITDLTLDNNQSSGNNIGKTTLLRIIDLCLGGKEIKKIYFDSDTNSLNDTVKNFLEENKVVGELILKDKHERKIILERELFEGGNVFLNNEKFKSTDYRKELKTIFFDSSEENPTFRDLIPKFIRLSNLTNENMLKFSTYNSDSKYDAIYTFLFKLKDEKLINEIFNLKELLKKIEKNTRILKERNGIISKSSLIQKKEIIENQLKEYDNIKKELNYLKTNYKDLEKIRSLLININNLEATIELLDFEIELIKENIKEMDSQIFKEDIFTLKQIYNEAKIFINKLDKNFEELVEFHNTMIDNRKKYIQSNLQEKEIERENILMERDKLLSEKEKLEKKEFSGNTFENLVNNSNKYEELLIEKGKVANSLEILEKVEEEKNQIILEINEKEKVTSTKADDIIIKFNKIFSDYSKRLYNESFLISYNENWKKDKVFPITCEGINGQVGTGTKKAIMVAFDLAYLEFSNQENISCPKFLIHDRLENTHINQIKTIFEISEKINGQFIVPILRERVNAIDLNIIDKCTILELSEKNKLFKI